MIMTMKILATISEIILGLIVFHNKTISMAIFRDKVYLSNFIFISTMFIIILISIWM